MDINGQKGFSRNEEDDFRTPLLNNTKTERRHVPVPIGYEISNKWGNAT
jgi:hypothetical protein